FLLLLLLRGLLRRSRPGRVVLGELLDGRARGRAVRNGDPRGGDVRGCPVDGGVRVAGTGLPADAARRGVPAGGGGRGRLGLRSGRRPPIGVSDLTALLGLGEGGDGAGDRTDDVGVERADGVGPTGTAHSRAEQRFARGQLPLLVHQPVGEETASTGGEHV